jgi:phospholipid N-methyltransferase
VDPANASVVLELGAGDGVITEQLLGRILPDSQLLVFEVNPVFMEVLKTNFSDERMALLHDSAENMGVHLNEKKIEHVDYVVSGIPFAVLPNELAEQIIDECLEWLRPGGKFIQFHYSPHMIPFYKKKFGNGKINFVPWNIPPAFVVSCVKK